jgi:hypothetical protein
VAPVGARHYIRGMKTHRIVLHGGAYRIEATILTGRRWLLKTHYPTEEAATVRLRALHAMADADMPDSERGVVQAQDTRSS